MDAGILLAIQENLRHPLWTPWVVAITSLNNGGILSILACVLMLAFRRTRRVGVVASASLAASAALVNLTIKPLTARIRPYEVIEGLELLVHPQSDFSFPSGHTSAAFAVAVVMLRLLPRRYGVPALVLAVLIALSRLYVGVHYPTDVLAGAVIGSTVALIACHVGRKWIAYPERGLSMKR